MAPPPVVQVGRARPRVFALAPSRQRRVEIFEAGVLLLPAVAILALSVFYPLVQALLLSVRHASLLNPTVASPAGLDNFARLAHDATFWAAVGNTIVFVVASVLGGLALGLALALLLNEQLPFRNVLRGIALVPWVVPGVVVALLFLYMFNSDVGVINYAAVRLGITAHFIDWFGSPDRALLAEIVANVWSQTPFYMLMILAGLQGVPLEEYEAADIDGASSVMKFRYVTFPHISHVLLVVTSLMTIWNFNNFDLIWATTQGGPINATTTLAVYVYRTAFIGLDISYAAAIGLVWLAVLLVFSVFYIRVLDRGERT